jgi:PAS domain-containing protein
VHLFFNAHNGLHDDILHENNTTQVFEQIQDKREFTMGIDKDKNRLKLCSQSEVRLRAKTIGLHPSLAEDTSPEKHTELYDFTPVGYFTLDRSGAISDVDISGARLLGFERARLFERRFEQFIPINARLTFSDFLVKVFASQDKESCETTLMNEDNRLHCVQIEATASASGQQCRIALIDITGYRQAEKALRENEEGIFRLAEMTVDTIARRDDSGAVTFNATAEKMFGCSAKEITGQDFQQILIPKLLLGAEEQGFARFRERRTRAR